MSEGSYRTSPPHPPEKRKTRRQRKNPTSGLKCQIMTYPVSEYSSKWVGRDFYKWVNKKWISDTTIPPFDNAFGASEEIETCIDDTIKSIFSNIYKKTDKDSLSIQALHTSFTNYTPACFDFVKEKLEAVHCIQTIPDIMRHLGYVTKYRMDSLFNLEYCNSGEKRLELLLRPNVPGLAENLYSSSEFIRKYKNYVKNIGAAFGIENLEKAVPFEKGMYSRFSAVTDERVTSMKGQGFAKKFGRIPWDSFFAGLGIVEHKWKTMQISYKYPAMIRGLSAMLRQYPIALWKLYISKIYLCNLARYTPPLDAFYFEFYGKYLQGLETKTPDTQLFLDFTYAMIPDTVSKLFWEACGDDEIVEGCRDIGNSIQKAAIARMRENPWLSAHSKIASIEKIRAIRYKIGKPDAWEPPLDLELDSTNFMKNRFLLGEYATRTLLSRLGTRHTYWEEGIFRVNAYYFSEFNEIVFPYGILANPFYSKSKSLAWNYGGLGCTFGHELCHAFDDDGKEYDPFGKVRKWWTHHDIRAFSKRARDLEKLYSSEKVLGRHLDGEITLSENIADISGMAICLEALRTKLKVSQEELLEHYREFFIAYATSWRTLYRTKQLRTSLAADEHSPAYLRVNIVVAQMDEWYEAFGIDERDPLYKKPEDRIRFF